MTITSDYAPQQYTGNGVTTVFSFPYPFYDSTDLIVSLTVIATGVTTVQTLTTHYAVNGGAGMSGNVTMVTAPTAAQRLTISRSIPYRQTQDYTENTAFPADTLEQGLDKAVVMAQQVKSLSDYTLKFPVTDTLASIGEIPGSVSRANSVLSFDASGVPSAVALGSLVASFDSVFTGLADDDLLKYDTVVSKWVNAPTIATAQIANLAVTVGKISSGAATSGQVLSADGAGNAAFTTPTADWVRLGTYNPSAAATVDITSKISATYDDYVIVYDNLSPATDGQGLRLQVSLDNGSSWRSTAGDYRYVRRQYYTDATPGGTGSSETNGYMGLGAVQVEATSGGASGSIWCYGMNNTAARKRFVCHGSFTYNTTQAEAYDMFAGAFTVVGSAVNALRLLFDAGNIASGQVVIYGIKKS